MKTLTLPLKRKWFETIRDGVKLEEYREMSDYWKKRLFSNKVFCKGVCEICNVKNCPKEIFSSYERLIFTLGYPKADDTSRRFEFKNPKIRIGTGRPEWGAEPGKMYFVITWEKK